MQTALRDIVGFFGSRKSHKCVYVSTLQLANKYGVFECQSMSVMTLVCARSEWINVGSPDLHVTTSINWLVAMAQYSWDSSQIAHSAAVISCFEFRWNFLKKWSSFVWSGSNFWRAKCRLKFKVYIFINDCISQTFIQNHSTNKYLPANRTHFPDQSIDIAVAWRSRCVRDHAASRVTHGGSRLLLNVSVNEDIFNTIITKLFLC